MSNPAMMQQSMQMASQAFGGQQNANSADATTGAAESNPMSAMMQQMMSNPQMMQQSMQMANQIQGMADEETNQQAMEMATQMLNDNPIDMQQSLEIARQ